MIKFGRNYRLTVQTNDDPPVDIAIEHPITLQFTVQRNVGASLNSMNAVIYNLSEETRSQIFQDRFGYFSNAKGTSLYRRVVLEAGYGDNLSIIFQGNLFEAGSLRQGSNILTLINARDGGLDAQNTKTFTTVEAGTSLQSLIKGLIGQFPNLNQGAVTDTGETIKRPATLSGNTFELLKTYSNYSVFIDSESVFVIADNEAIRYEGEIAVIDAEAGLLETPRRDDAGLTITTLFEPRIQLGQMIEIASTVQPLFNGQYKVIAVTHQGIISGAVGGECSSTFVLLLNGATFGTFTEIKKETTRVNLDAPPAN